MLLSDKVRTEISANGIVSKETMIEIWELSQKVKCLGEKYNGNALWSFGDISESSQLVLYCIELEIKFNIFSGGYVKKPEMR